MKEFNVIIDSTIKLISSNMIERIIMNSGYFDSIEDISDQLNAENTMGFDVFSIVPMLDDQEEYTKNQSNKYAANKEKNEDLLYESVENYLEIALQDILEEINSQLNITTATSSYSIIDVEDGINALVYLYFGDYYLH
ncbi:MAG: hypothetical protein AB2421_08550 [Thermotaleaceae bacterium]